MKVLITTAMYPTPKNPAFGSYVRTQVEALRQIGVEIELLVLQGRSRKLIYPKGVVQLHRRLTDGSIDLVHAHYSYVGMVARMQWKVPVIITYHGSDLLGTIDARGQQSHFAKFVAGMGRSLSRLADAGIVQSKQMASKLQYSNVYVIPHEVNLQVFRPVERDRAKTMLGLDLAKRYLLFAANPEVPVKRYP